MNGDESLLSPTAEIIRWEAGSVSEWEVGQDPRPEVPWIAVERAGSSIPVQGWKLHLSADRLSALSVLQRAIPILVREGASFKVAASLRVLDALNQGEAGISQIGKFITVYPQDDDQAIRLALALDNATRGLSGPLVPSDHPLQPGSLVHYRYGSFDERYVLTPSGEVLRSIVSPDGQLVPDQSGAIYRAPNWVVDPFLRAGIAQPSKQKRLVARRYLIVGTLHRSPRGTICVAVDLEKQRRCVVKWARRGALLGADGRDARDYLRHEFAVLERLSADPRFPTPFELVREDDEVFLAMEYVEGELLARRVSDLSVWGRLAPGEQVIAWGRELATALEAIHAKNLVYRDLNSTNVIVAPDGCLRLIDFELACTLGDPDPLDAIGTRGYHSPQQAAGSAPSVADDVYGLGALLYCMATGAEPALAPDPSMLLARPPTLFNPGLATALERIIARCLDQEPSRRFQSMQDVDAALAHTAHEASVSPPPLGGEPTDGTDDEARSHYRGLARRLADTIVAVARPVPGKRWLAWESVGPGERSIPYRDLGHGTAGTVLALAELAREFGQPEYRHVLAQAAQWLIASEPEDITDPGLYLGEAGVAAALLRAGQVLGEAALIDAAAQRSRRIASIPYSALDQYSGAAGRLRLHLLVWDETTDAEHLNAAVQAGRALLAGAERAHSGEYIWTTENSGRPEEASVYLGYAHGAAGIADALLDLFETTGEDELFSVAENTAGWLSNQAVPVLDDESGLDWPDFPGRPPAGALWCHGATGIGRFLLHASQLGMPWTADLADRAGRAVARSARSAVGPSQCHGLAGRIEFLLDLAQATRVHAYIAEARSLARLLEAFACERGGLLVWPSDSPINFPPTYLTGYAGIALSLLRLSKPEQLPHLLSRAGFRPS